MNSAYLLLGSNMGNSVEIVGLALAILEKECGHISKKSSLYETEPWGFESESNFLNIVVCIETERSALSLLSKIHETEQKLGRTRTNNQYTSRLIDIDILLFNDTIIESEILVIPHPRMHLRQFVLQPLSEIAGDFVHPVFLKSINQLLTECADTKNVVLSNDN